MSPVWMGWEVGAVGLQQQAVERDSFCGLLKAVSIFIGEVAGKGDVVAQGEPSSESTLLSLIQKINI